ncbi:hypothetical protein ASPACDRAFT_81835 [Aspergillus aculeatus ATCC 16872]|uniref:Major facilitator superfamily (MFS) profile domain-containing protein n=1 Tax=Aspergillus aculeatus (strain ATCC 16872 / CBS 172.66 / WB 5094) TaxID=690307 RepID=A0A1L9WI16_ASPA1|nr:uncharacterized protein ASPACDRAFT_81835 [Aspergillus aculeatus ATCC 16872]OJJ95793.1 hypothetical protein ASPACDRAFT_81835 [Aspergillus aculeatus ATCC 16872]
MKASNPPDKHTSDNIDELVNGQDDGGETEFSISRQDALMLLAMASLSLMAALDGTSISVALPTISQDLGGTAIEAFWTGTSFTLCSAVFQPVFSSLSDLFGRKPLVLVAIAWFTIGAIVAGVAHNFTHMLVGRSLQGIGGGGIITLTGILIADIVPLSARAKYFGMLSAIWSLGTVVGPVIGGCFAEKVTWRWIFYINFPFIGIGAILVAWSSSARAGKQPFATQVRQIDFLGIALFIPSSAAFLIPLTWGGVLYAWDSWHTLVPLLIGCVGLCVFAVYEWRGARHPMIPPAIFQNRTALISFAGYAVVGLLVWCCLYFLPLYYEAVKCFQPILSGIALFPETFTVAPSGVIVGLLISRTGQYYWAVCVGWCLSTLGLGLLCLLDVHTGTVAWVFLNLVPGVGIGMLLPSVALAVQASATPETLAIAVATSTSFRGFGQSIGVAIGGVIFQNRMKSNLLRYPALQSLAGQYSGDAAGAVELIRGMHGPVKVELQQAYADSLRIVWAFCCGISGLMLIVSPFTQSYDLNRVLVTKQGPGEEEIYARENKTLNHGGGAAV